MRVVVESDASLILKPEAELDGIIHEIQSRARQLHVIFAYVPRTCNLSCVGHIVTRMDVVIW